MRCRPLAPARGVSLVEALVALAVMAFGMLAIVGLQATMRLNSDVAKQRSEAVRIAQEALEQWRAFTSIDAVAGQMAYADIASAGPTAVAGYTTNTAYSVTRTAADAFGSMARNVQVVVAWIDRNGQAQRVELDSLVSRTDPSVSGSLAQRPAAFPVRQPLGRHATIPLDAVDLGDGKSAWRPPGAAADAAWLFDNLTGALTGVCIYADANLSLMVPADACTAQPSFVISGYVRFEYGANPNATAPTGEQTALDVVANGSGDGNGECYAAPVSSPKLTYTSYACRVPKGGSGTWTGTTRLTPPLSPGAYDVCRYQNGAAGNAGHPATYVALNRSLTDQNFLVVDKDVPCPAGTAAHQPSS